MQVLKAKPPKSLRSQSVSKEVTSHINQVKSPLNDGRNNGFANKNLIPPLERVGNRKLEGIAKTRRDISNERANIHLSNQ